MNEIYIFLIFLALLLIWMWWYRKNRQKRELKFIQNYNFPKPVIDKFKKRYPNLSSDEIALVKKALKDYFYICNLANGKMVTMPTRVTDDLWHEFILFSSLYESFCKKAFGRFLHHIPDEAMAKKDNSNDGLKRAWLLICQKEKINPKFPDRLPLLFAIDAILKIENGVKYSLSKLSVSIISNTQGSSCGTGAGCGGFYVGDLANSSSFGESGSFGDVSDGSGCGGGCGGA